ncbi:MAG: hypothetical protein MZW92_68390 [Comamonadaceae bacterium]|nr:hypothetical protein [Comamonadaceae bacterium]
MNKTRWLLAVALIAAVAASHALDLGQYFSVAYFKSQQAGIDAYYQANPVADHRALLPRVCGRHRRCRFPGRRC